MPDEHRSFETDAVERRDAGLTDGVLLRVIEGSDAGVELDLPSGLALVGTKDTCQLRLTDATVSGTHLNVEVTASGLVVTDLGSRNGTLYLETRIERAILNPGSVLRLGNTRLALLQRRVESSLYSRRASYGRLVGSSPSMRRLYGFLEQLEPSTYTVLIGGETGTGKDVVAHEIHAHSARAGGPFEVCDCGALPRNLVESELFGHVRGAFTGAEGSRQGAFLRAQGGTLFLDEIGELPLEVQPTLLRALESRQIRAIGSDKTVTVDTRILAATNRNLLEEVRQGRFRQDLLFRLNPVSLDVPPLRQRREDIPDLVRALLADAGRSELALSAATIELFTTGYDWPGNVRELRNAIIRVLAFGSPPDTVGQHLSSAGAERPPNVDIGAGFQEAKRRVVDAFERDYLRAIFVAAGGNISRAARAADVERNDFKRLLRKHRLLEQ